MGRRQLRSLAVLFGSGAILFALPEVVEAPFVWHVIVVSNIYAIFALSWDVLAGFAGEVSFGQALFFGVAAYSTAFLNATGVIPSAWTSLGVGIAISVVAGAAIGIPCLRLQGPYLAIVTLASSQIAFLMIFALHGVTGGEEGVRGIRSLVIGTVANYRLSVILLLIAVTLVYLLTESRVGLVFRAIKDNRVTAEGLGVNPVLYKTLAYCVSAALAGAAGGFQAHYLKIVTPDTLALPLTFSVITIVVIGGIGTVFGPVLAAYAVTFLFNELQVLSDYRLFLYSVVLIVCMLFFPNGLYGGLRAVGSLLRRRTMAAGAPRSARAPGRPAG
jgi:branched-chain amino acid transport system permease protein